MQTGASATSIDCLTDEPNAVDGETTRAPSVMPLRSWHELCPARGRNIGVAVPEWLIPLPPIATTTLSVMSSSNDNASIRERIKVPLPSDFPYDWSSLENSESIRASHQGPIRWVTCHVIGAWSPDAERPCFHVYAGCYHGNRPRYHGNHGLNGNQDCDRPARCNGQVGSGGFQHYTIR